MSAVKATRLADVTIVPGIRVQDAQALRRRILERRRGYSLTVRIADRLATSTTERVLVLLGDPKHSWSDQLDQRLTTRLEDRVTTILAYDPAANYDGQAPKSLRRINGFAWPEAASPDPIVDYLLRLLGVDERNRRVFLSYARGHSETMARQIRYSLLDKKWNVFLDSIDIDPGVDFQKELFRDLDGRSLVLVIEHPRTRTRPWVDAEIAYANAHGVGLHALQQTSREGVRPRFPSGITTRRPAVIDPTAGTGSSRGSTTRLSETEILSLTSALQAAHTVAYRLRTDDAVANVMAVATNAGASVQRLDEQTVHAKVGDRNELIRATSSRPALRDISDIIAARGELGLAADSPAWIVHRLRDPDQNHLDIVSRVAARAAVQVQSLSQFRHAYLRLAS